MRIVSGKFKGIRFEPPRDITARPTTDFAKESLFNILDNIIDFEGIRVLDLFSGTGSISYEFVSRGARSVTSIEMNTRQIDFIKKTCTKLKICTCIVAMFSNTLPSAANATMLSLPTRLIR